MAQVPRPNMRSPIFVVLWGDQRGKCEGTGRLVNRKGLFPPTSGPVHPRLWRLAPDPPFLPCRPRHSEAERTADQLSKVILAASTARRMGRADRTDRTRRDPHQVTARDSAEHSVSDDFAWNAKIRSWCRCSGSLPLLGIGCTSILTRRFLVG